MKGKIICMNKYIHRVLLENNTIIDTRTRGKLRNQTVSPVVGDNVIVDINNKTIEKVEPRKNYLERPLIANIDKLLIVMSTSIPVFSDYLIDKFLLIANYNNIEPIIKIDNNISDIISDEKAVKRIFANLIGNILKHGARNVIIALHEEKDYIVSSFINYAPLLNEEDAKRIFERFYTADKSRGDRNTGLGLAIVKEISERLGNKISSRLIDGNLNIEIKWKK